MIIQPKTIDPGWGKRGISTMQWAVKWFSVCRSAMLEIAGYAAAIFLAETLVKIWVHG